MELDLLQRKKKCTSGIAAMIQQYNSALKDITAAAYNDASVVVTIE